MNKEKAYIKKIPRVLQFNRYTSKKLVIKYKYVDVYD